MKSPPFKVNSKTDCLVRYTDHRGKRQVRSGRRTFVVNHYWLWNVAVRDYGTDYELRLRGGPWHRVHATQAEARAIFEANPAPRQHLPWKVARRD